MTPKDLVQAVSGIRAGYLRAEGEALLPLYLAGVRIVPSDMVDCTTVLVTPKTYAALKEAVART